MRPWRKPVGRNPKEIVEIALEPRRGLFLTGYQFKRLSSLDPFVIDQTRTVNFNRDRFRLRILREFSSELEQRGGTAGFLSAEAPYIPGKNDAVDAILLSTQNDLE